MKYTLSERIPEFDAHQVVSSIHDKQSGLRGFRFADLRRDLELLRRCRDIARELLDADPELAQAEGASGA